jgi:acetyltransferase
MSTDPFDRLFAPRTVAMVGATDRAGSVGAVTIANLRNRDFDGVLYLVNPKHAAIGGTPCFPDVEHLPDVPDVAVIATPPDQVASVIRQLGAKGGRAAVVLTAGFGEMGERGRAMQREIAETAAAQSVRIIGPNCVGIMNPAAGLNASFAHLAPARGDVAFVSQSGALITAVLDWAKPHNIGFSKVVSLGDMADVDFGDILEYLSVDAATRAILLYVEGFADGAKFMAAARAAAAHKPVIVIKVGRHAEAAKAAHSHTGALAGADVVYDAAFRRAGMLRVATLPGMFDAVETLGRTGEQRGNRLTILTNGGGPGVLATDALISAGGVLAQLAPDTIAQLNALLPPTWSHGNPVDMIGDAGAKEYHATLDILLRDSNSDAILVLNCPTALSDPSEAARAVIDALAARASKINVLTSWLGEYSAAPARALFDAARIPTYETPDDAIDGLMCRVRFGHSQAVLAEQPVPRAFTGGEVERVLADALAADRRWLDTDAVSLILGAYGIPVVPSRTVADAQAAAAAARELGVPVALKLRSPDITHKSDVGAVALNLNGGDAVREEALAMLQRVRAARPDARIEGFFVQSMVNRPRAIELIAGVTVDAVFGPIVLFGRGGTAVEVIADTSLELVPLNPALARLQMQRTRVWKMLQAYRGQAAADVDAIADVLVALGDMVIAHPQIAELDINPLLADDRGVLALDVRIAVEAKAHTLPSLAYSEVAAV